MTDEKLAELGVNYTKDCSWYVEHGFIGEEDALNTIRILLDELIAERKRCDDLQCQLSDLQMIANGFSVLPDRSVQTSGETTPTIRERGDK